MRTEAEAVPTFGARDVQQLLNITQAQYNYAVRHNLLKYCSSPIPGATKHFRRHTQEQLDALRPWVEAQQAGPVTPATTPLPEVMPALLELLERQHAEVLAQNAAHWDRFFAYLAERFQLAHKRNSDALRR